MNTVHLLTLMRDDSHTVVVKFDDPRNGTGQSKGYTYKALKAWGVQKGDTVVVDTQYGMKTAEVVEAHDGIDIDFNNESFDSMSPSFKETVSASFKNLRGI